MKGGVGGSVAATGLTIQAGSVGGEGFRCMLEDHREEGYEDRGEGEDICRLELAVAETG